MSNSTSVPKPLFICHSHCVIVADDGPSRPGRSTARSKMTRYSCLGSSRRPSKGEKTGHTVWPHESSSGCGMCVVHELNPSQWSHLQPRYLEPAASILPYLPRYAISMSLAQLRTYFFSHCHGFSVMYEALASADGARFRKECRQAGKAICAWTVNGKEEMRQCARWEIQSVISDKPDQWRKIKDEVGLRVQAPHS